MTEHTDTERLDLLERMIMLQGWELIGGWIGDVTEHCTMRELLDAVLTPPDVYAQEQRERQGVK